MGYYLEDRTEKTVEDVFNLTRRFLTEGVTRSYLNESKVSTQINTVIYILQTLQGLISNKETQETIVPKWTLDCPPSFRHLSEKLIRAKKKFPQNNKLTAVLMKEVGDLTLAELSYQTKEQILESAMRVACTAIRIAEEGDSDFAQDESEES